MMQIYKSVNWLKDCDDLENNFKNVHFGLMLKCKPKLKEMP